MVKLFSRPMPPNHSHNDFGSRYRVVERGTLFGFWKRFLHFGSKMNPQTRVRVNEPRSRVEGIGPVLCDYYPNHRLLNVVPLCLGAVMLDNHHKAVTRREMKSPVRCCKDSLAPSCCREDSWLSNSHRPCHPQS
jgi:hypothetical protein